MLCTGLPEPIERSPINCVGLSSIEFELLCRATEISEQTARELIIQNGHALPNRTNTRDNSSLIFMYLVPDSYLQHEHNSYGRKIPFTCRDRCTDVDHIYQYLYPE